MGFTDLVADAGLTALNTWLKTRSYIVGYTPTQADVTVYKSVSNAPDAGKYPHAARWHKQINSYVDDFETLPGDSSLPASAYGPETAPTASNLPAASSLPAASNPPAASNLPAASNPPSASNPAKAPAEEDDEDVDLFGSDDEEDDAEKEALTKKRLEEYAAKKASKGPKPAAKSLVTLEVKPWDDETNLKEMEENVRSIEMEGLVWGASKLITIGYGIQKLQINLVVEDEKVSIDDLQQAIEAFEDHVQSTDVAAMQKL